MRHMTFVTIHPEFVRAYFEFGVFKSAVQRGLLALDVVDLRDFAVDKHGSVDDDPYGGGDGMVLRPEPLADAVNAIRQQTPNAKVVLTSPAGRAWTSDQAESFADCDDSYIFICGRFAGIDQRFIDAYVDLEVSLGDYVISGGELASLVMGDAILRFIPGVLGHAESAKRDSFGSAFEGALEHPLYTRPAAFAGVEVPSVLRSGDHEAIAQWRRAQSLDRTQKRRPDLL